MYHPDFAHLLRLFLAEALEKLAPITVKSLLAGFLYFERFVNRHRRFRQAPGTFTIAHLTLELLAVFATHAKERTSSKGIIPSLMRRFYRWGVRRKLPGFSVEIASALQAIRYTTALAGHIVRMAHPTKGAFSWEEEQLIKRRLEERRGRLEDRALVSIFHRLGIRPEAAVQLRCRHLRWIDFPDGRKYFLDVPRVKRRGGTTKEITTERLIDSFLAELLLEVMETSGDGDALIFHWLGHRAKQNLGYALKHGARDAELVTIRSVPTREQEGTCTQDLAPVPLNVFPYRFRRTMATNMAADGASAEEIAAALDDDLSAMAAVYVENSAALVDVLQRTLDRHPDWVRVIRLFLGEIACPTDIGLPPVYGGIPHFADYIEFSDIGIIGHCGNPDTCRKEPPLDCYPCESFRAVRSRTPHERQLVQIDRELNRCHARESDRMANLVRPHVTAIIELLQFVTNTRAGFIVRSLSTTSGDAV